jgi:hypothetical protein
VGAAVLSLLAVPVKGAQAAPADPVDVEARLELPSRTTAPGERFGVRAIADVESGQVPKLGLTLTLPQGVTYQGTIDNAANGDCTPSADGRTVTCVPNDGQMKLVSAEVAVKVGADVAPGTELAFTTTADIGDAVDVKPENNTATGKVTVTAPADLGIEWKAPSGLVNPGEDVETDLVVTNHGPGPVEVESVDFQVGWDYWPKSGVGKNCWADPGVLVCDVNRELAPGETVTLPFTWNFPVKAAGTTYRVPTRLLSSSPIDPNRANDKTELVIKFAKPSTSTPGPTPTSSPTPEPSVSSSSGSGSGSGSTPQGGGGQLAETGAGPVAAAAAGAVALALAGGALVVRNRARRFR